MRIDFARPLASLLCPVLCLVLCPALVLTWTLPARGGIGFLEEITIKDEIELGKEFDEQVRKQLPVLEDPLVNGYVKSVVDRIAAAMPNELPYPVTTAVINNRAMNAFAVPGGYVYVFTGLILGLETEDQLAGVLAHELAHIARRHAIERYESMKLISIASMVGSIGGALLGATGSGHNAQQAAKAAMVLSQAGAASAFLLYTQENEREADHVGMEYLTRANYDPDGMPETFEVMLRNKWNSSSSEIPSYLSTHPGLNERVGYLKERVSRMEPDVVERHTDSSRFLRVQAVLKGRIADPSMTLAEYDDATEHACLDHMAAGMAAQRLGKDALGRELFETALACGSSDPLVLREAGRFYFKAGDFDAAQPLLQKAMFLDPSDLLTLFYNARLLGERGQYQAAIDSMGKILDALPRDPEVHYYLGRMLGETGDTFQAHVHLAYASYYGRDPAQARFHLDKARGLADTPERQEILARLSETVGS